MSIQSNVNQALNMATIGLGVIKNLPQTKAAQTEKEAKKIEGQLAEKEKNINKGMEAWNKVFPDIEEGDTFKELVQYDADEAKEYEEYNLLRQRHEALTEEAYRLSPSSKRAGAIIKGRMRYSDPYQRGQEALDRFRRKAKIQKKQQENLQNTENDLAGGHA